MGLRILLSGHLHKYETHKYLCGSALQLPKYSLDTVKQNFFVYADVTALNPPRTATRTATRRRQPQERQAGSRFVAAEYS